MNWLWIFLIIFWIIVIAFPAILVFLIWGFFIFIWINILIISWILKKSSKWKEDYIKFGKYKIYR